MNRIVTVHNDYLSFSIIVIINNHYTHIIQDRVLQWNKPVVYDMLWDIEQIEIIRPIVRVLLNRVGTKSKEIIPIDELNI